MSNLIMEDVIPDVVPLGVLRCQNESLHEPPHRLPVVRELPSNLYYNSVAKSLMGVHLLIP